MTSDASMRSSLAPGRPPPRKRRAVCSPSGIQAILARSLLVVVALSACRGDGGASGDGGVSGGDGSNGAITLEPEGDTLLGPLDEFDPANLRRSFMLGNGTALPLAWEAQVSEPWLSLPGPASGELAPESSVEVMVDIDSSEAGAEEGAPAVANVVFRESITGAVLATRTVTVETSFGSQAGSGWTTLTRSADTRAVFVSSSAGDDLHDGLTPTTPKRTLAAGIALLRHGYPDWLLLRRGDVWQESLGQWKKSGRGQHEPMVVTTYGDGTGRPLLRTGALPGLITHGGGSSPATIDCVAFVGLHFLADGYTGGGDCVGAQFLQPGAHLLIEDCKFEGYSTNLVFQGYGGRHEDFRLRRSVVVDAYAVHAIGGHSQGLYAHAVDGLLIEENVFDHNGWNENVPGAGADIYSHNLYVDNGNSDVVVRGNVIANGSSHGLQLRPGGAVINNLFVRNSIAMLVGGGNNPEPGGVQAMVFGNVILDGKDIDAANPRGWGMVFANIASGTVAFNVVASNVLGGQPVAMVLDGDHVGDTSASIGIHGLRIDRNVIYAWDGGVYVEGDDVEVTDIEFRGNDVQNPTTRQPLLEHREAASTHGFTSVANRFFAAVPQCAIGAVPRTIAFWKVQVGDSTSAVQPAVYPDPDRSVASYHARIGGAASLEAFLEEAREQSWSRWRTRYTAAIVNRYLRRGF
jgi:hypothetical protein